MNKKKRIFCCFLYIFFISLPLGIAQDKKTASVLTYFILAKLYQAWDESEISFYNYQKALKLDYDNAIIHLNLGIAYIKQNAIEKAIEELELAQKLSPDLIEPSALLAIIYSIKGESKMANQYYETALKNVTKLQPKNTEIYHDLARFYLEEKRFREAEELYRLILNISQDDYKAHFYLGVIYDELKQKDSAIKEFKEAIRLNPNYAEALNYLGYLYVEENIFLEEAELLIKKALEIEPQNPAYLDSLGWLYFKKGKIEKAREYLEKAISYTEDPLIYEHLGEVYFTMKDLTKAKELWQKSLELDPKQERIKEKLERALISQ